ncbi:MAG TPA: phosphoribosylformylglycinamidine cyclo-ligase [Chloroflexota bacterium]|nr:phosphoribosylformylglycinamidine cyclo-ligase [Chloroflexota bacterium]
MSVDHARAPRLEPADAAALHTYADAGVDIDAGEHAVRLMRQAVEASRTAQVVSRLGAFGAAVRSPGSHMLLVSSTDGVGSKVCLVASDEEAAGIGRDLVHHCIDDILTCGAAPLFFLDYLAFARLDPPRAAAIVAGMAAAGAAHGCALVGGETAELPDLYREHAFDVAGCIVGTVAEDRFLDGSRIMPGDTLIGLPSAGLHTNGYTLARRLLADRLHEPCGAHTVRQALLAEHRCYLPAMAPLLERGLVHGLAHITGGGLPGNLPRMLPAGLAARLDPQSWSSLPIFDLLGGYGLSREELFRTFNMGIGMVLACASSDAAPILATLQPAYAIGEVIEQGEEARVLGL